MPGQEEGYTPEIAQATPNEQEKIAVNEFKDYLFGDDLTPGRLQAALDFTNYTELYASKLKGESSVASLTESDRADLDNLSEKNKQHARRFPNYEAEYDRMGAKTTNMFTAFKWDHEKVAEKLRDVLTKGIDA